MATTKHRVPGKQTVYYFPSFVSEDEETFLLRKVLVIRVSCSTLELYTTGAVA